MSILAFGPGLCRRWSFSDAHDNLVSMISLETVRDLERLLARPIDPLRFRANIYVEGIPAWSELQWQGPIRIDSTFCLEVAGRIDRCAATNVDPTTGARDLQIPPPDRRDLWSP